MEDQLCLPSLRFSVTPETLVLFTTVLQSGIEVMTEEGESIGKFLNKFPGFSAEYVADIVQTIFINGTAVDDLTSPLSGKNPVLALSAAMPGLAGAIFRRNSFHSALRTNTQKELSASTNKEPVTVTLKLFNRIARERGLELLNEGVCIKAEQLANFLTRSPSLLQHIKNIQLGDKEIDETELFRVLPELAKLNLNITEADG